MVNHCSDYISGSTDRTDYRAGTEEENTYSKATSLRKTWDMHVQPLAWRKRYYVGGRQPIFPILLLLEHRHTRLENKEKRKKGLR